MSIPVTARLDEDVVAALDEAVAGGLGPNRAAVVAAAVKEWLRAHGEEAVADSYRRRYAEPDAEHEELVSRLAAFSVAACLATNDR